LCVILTLITLEIIHNPIFNFISKYRFATAHISSRRNHDFPLVLKYKMHQKILITITFNTSSFTTKPGSKCFSCIGGWPVMCCTDPGITDTK